MAQEHVKLGEIMAVGVVCAPPPLNESVDFAASIEVETSTVTQELWQHHSPHREPLPR